MARTTAVAPSCFDIVDALSEPLKKAKGICTLAAAAHGPDADAFRAAAWAASDLIQDAEDALSKHGGGR